MNYPERLIPIPIFKRIEADLDGHFICRTFQKNDWQINDEILNESLSEFFDYSTNLLGHFQFEDNFISLIGENKPYFRSYWDFTERVEIPVYKMDFDFYDDKGVFFLNISNIHRKLSIPFNVKGQNPNDKATAYIIHTPTRSNFWHFSIRWFKENGDCIKKSDASWKSLLVTSMRALLYELVDLNIPESFPIPEEYFLKK